MALVSKQITPNQAPAEYFSIIRGEIICAPGELEPRLDIWMGQYVDEAARRIPGVNPLHQHRVPIMFKDMNVDLRVILYQMVKDSGFFGETEVLDSIDNNVDLTLDALKVLKKAEIQRAKNRANKDHFLFDGVKFQANDDAMLQIQTTMNGILSRGNKLREDWPGAWLAQDNTPYPIPDVETWFAFHAAIETTGQENFNRAVALKLRVDAALTADEVDLIHWNMDLTPPPMVTGPNEPEAVV